MNLVIKKRFAVVYNTLFFLVISFFLLYVSLNISKGKTSLSLDQFKFHYYFFISLLSILMVTLIQVYRLKRSSIYFILIYITLILFSFFFLDKDSISKVSFFSFFLLIVSAHSFFQSLVSELNEPYLNPLFTNKDLSIRSTIPVQALVYKEGFEDHVLSHAFITNWTHTGCFLRLNQKIDTRIKRVRLVFKFAKVEFENNGNIMAYSKDKLGIGICFDYNKKQEKSWSSLYELLYKLGLLPQYVT